MSLAVRGSGRAFESIKVRPKGYYSLTDKRARVSFSVLSGEGVHVLRSGSGCSSVLQLQHGLAQQHVV